MENTEVPRNLVKGQKGSDLPETVPELIEQLINMEGIVADDQQTPLLVVSSMRLGRNIISQSFLLDTTHIERCPLFAKGNLVCFSGELDIPNRRVKVTAIEILR